MSLQSPPASASIVMTHRTRIAVQPVKAPQGWSAVVLTQEYPVPESRLPSYTSLLRELLAVLPETATHHPEAFVQMDRIDHARQAPLIRDLGSLLGDYGLGYFPDQPPPTTWTQEEIAALFPPAKLRPLFHDVMRVESSSLAIAEVAPLFGGTGCFAWAFCREASSFYARCTAQFKPLVISRKLLMFPYYAPLLTRRAIESCDTDQMADWACGAQLYVRESLEDNGLLVLRQGDLLPSFRALVHGDTLPEIEFVTGWSPEAMAHE